MFLLETVVSSGADAVATQATAAAAAKAPMDIAQYIQRINWAAPSWDLFIVLFCLVAVFLYGMSLGRDRVIVVLVSIYMALAVAANAPFLDNLKADVALGDFFAFRISTFLGVFLLLFFLLSRSALLRTFGNMASGSWWQVLMFSTFHVGLLVSIVLSYLPKEAVALLAPETQKIFATETARFVWISMPIVAMVLIKSEPLDRSVGMR
jgi:hypothetical protein